MALFLENSPAFVIAYLGVQYAHGIVVLVNTQYRQVELAHILTDSGARACVTGAAGAAELVPLLPGLPSLTWLITVEPPTVALPPQLSVFAFDALHCIGASLLLGATVLALIPGTWTRALALAE